MLGVEGSRLSASAAPTSKQHEVGHRATTDSEYTDRTSKHFSVDFSKSQDFTVEFVAPIAGTPAAVALAGKFTSI
jgi:hypothetical protein